VQVNTFSKQDFEDGKILLFNKEIGWTSFDVVKKVKNLIRQAYQIKKIKVGHAGTLDPLASGLLIVCTGKFTKKISDIQVQRKIYTGEITLGSTTPSYDLETPIDKTFNFSNISAKDVMQTATKFIGEIQQKPPIYSAIKVKGERLYEKARKGESIDIKSRKTTIFSFEIKDITLPHFQFRIECSKGTYIRSIADDFGKHLKNGAHLSRLARIQIGEYNLDQALTVDEFKNQLNL
jgi:tRNA pseudouridine55 synthase